MAFPYQDIFVNLPDSKWMGVGSIVGRCKDSHDGTWHGQRESLLKAFKYIIVSPLPLSLSYGTYSALATESFLLLLNI